MDDYLLAIDQLDARLAEVDAQLVTVATVDPYREPVAWLRCFRGIDTLTAILLLAELHDVQRFPTARALMAYLGLVPGEHSSGDRHRRGPITNGQHPGSSAGGGSGVALSAPAWCWPDAPAAAERATGAGDCAGGQGAAAVVSPLPAAGRAQAGPSRHRGRGPRTGRISVGGAASGVGVAAGGRCPALGTTVDAERGRMRGLGARTTVARLIWPEASFRPGTDRNLKWLQEGPSRRRTIRGTIDFRRNG